MNKNILNLTGFYISIALTRAYATCHSERKEPLALSAAEGEESHTRNGTKSCSKARCFASLSVRSPSDSMTVLKSVKLRRFTIWTEAEISSSLGPTNPVFRINLQDNRLGYVGFSN